MVETHGPSRCRESVLKMAADGIEAALLRKLNENGDIPDSGEFASSIGADHLAVVGVIKSLQSAEMIVSQVG